MVAFRSKKDGKVKGAKVISFNSTAGTYTVRTDEKKQLVAVEMSRVYSLDDVSECAVTDTDEGIRDVQDFLQVLNPETENADELGETPPDSVPEETHSEHRSNAEKWGKVSFFILVFVVFSLVVSLVNVYDELGRMKKIAETKAEEKSQAQIVAEQVNVLNIETAKYAGACERVKTLNDQKKTLLDSINTFK